MIGLSLTSCRKNHRRFKVESSARPHRVVRLEHLEPRLPLTASIIGGDIYATIQAAIDHARPNDAITITPGIYAERVDLSRMGTANGFPQSGNLALRGVGGAVTINPTSGRAMQNSSPFVGNLTIDNIGFTSPTSAGFVLAGYQGDLRILNSQFNNNVTRRAIELSNTTGSILIANSEIRDMATKGIWMSNVENVLIDHVTIDAQGTVDLIEEQDGIYGLSVFGIQILNSEIRYVGSVAADDGIDLTNPRGKVFIANNLIHHVGDDGIQITTTDAAQASVTLSHNQIRDNTGGGIDLRTQGASTAQTAATISGNVFSSLGDHSLDISYQSGAQLTAVIDDNVVSNVNVEAAMVLHSGGDAALSVDFTRNLIQDSNGHGLRVLAEDRSQFKLFISENTLQRIGDEGSDDGILLESKSSASATIDAIVDRNLVRTVSGAGLSVRGLGQTKYHVTAIDNSFDDTNRLSDRASVIIDKSVANDATVTHLFLKDNTVTNSHGTDAYRLNQQGSGVMDIVGIEATAQEVIENHNTGRPVVVLGTVGVIQPIQLLTVSSSATQDQVAKVGEPVTLTGTFRASSLVQDLAVVITWGDASSSSTSVSLMSDGSYSFTSTHPYRTGGLFAAAVTVLNDAEAEAITTTTAWVTGWRVTSDGELQILGTDQKDQVEIKLGKTNGTLEVKTKLAGSSATSIVGQVGRILIHLGPGDDEAKIDDRVAINAEIYGAGGKDTLTGGGGSDLLFGGEGNDTLKGGSGNDALSGGDGDDRVESGMGRDVLIGGRGFDHLSGVSLILGNILIAGRTSHDADPTALRQILAKWTSGQTYEVILQDLTKSDGLLEVGKQVFDDHAKDELFGEDLARDLFFADQDKKNGDDDSVKRNKWDTLIELGELLGV